MRRTKGSSAKREPRGSSSPFYESDRVDKIWTEDELARLSAVCSPEIHAVVVLALWTGRRQGDLLKLTWSAYDGAYVRLRQSKSRKHGKPGRSIVVPAGQTLQAAPAAIPQRESAQILNLSHCLSRDIRLAEQAIVKLETSRRGVAGTARLTRPARSRAVAPVIHKPIKP